MKIILGFIIILFSSCLFCQQTHKSFELFREGKYSEAIPEFERDLPDLIRVWGDKDTVRVIQIYGLLANCYVQTGQNEFAIKNYEKAIEIGNYYKDFNNESHFYNVYNYLNFLRNNNLIIGKEQFIIDVLYKNWKKITVDKRKNLIVLLDEINQKFKLSFRSKLDIYINESMDAIFKIYSEYYTLDSIFKFQFYNKNDYGNALLTANKLIGISKSEFGINSLNYFLDNQSHASCYFEMKEYEKSKQTLLRIIENINSCYDCSSENYISTLTMLSFVCEQLKNYQDAIKYRKMIVSFYDTDPSKYHIDKYYALNRIGKVYNDEGSFSKAEKYYLDAIDYSKQFYDYNNMYIAMTSLGIAYLSQNLFSKAYLAFMESIDFYEREGNMNIHEYCVIISNFNKLYPNLNKSLEGKETTFSIYKKYEAETNFNQQILETCTNELGEFYTDEEDHLNAVKYFELSLKYSIDTLAINYINTMINLGMSYEKISEYKKAEKYLIKGLELMKNKKDSDPKGLATAYNNLSVLYINMNSYKNAEHHLKESIEITENLIGKDNIEYGTRLNNLAEIYTKLNNFEKAKEYYVNSIKNAINFEGSQSQAYMIRTMNYAIFLQNCGQYDSAMVLFIELLDLSQKNGYKYPKTEMSIFMNAGTFLVAIVSFESALKILLLAEKNQIDYSLQNTKEYATLLNNIAFCYMNLNSKKEALEYSKRSLNLNNILFGQTSLESLLSLSALSKIYFRFSDFDQALNTIDEAYNTYKNNKLEKDLGIEINILKDYALVNLQFKNFSIVTKVIDSIIVKLNKFEKLHLNFQSEKELEELITYLGSNYDIIRNILFRLAVYNIEPSSMYSYDLELFQKQLIISTLLDRAKLESNYPSSFNKDFSGVKKSLEFNQNAIEFSSFRYLNSNSWTDSVFYVALLLNSKEAIPKMIKLCEQKQLDSIFIRTGERESNHVNNIYKNKRLYELIWKPIEPYVNKGDQIYFSPSGFLHQISISAIAKNDSTYLGDHYNFNQVGSTGVLASENMTIKPVKDIVVFGGIDFDASDEQVAAIAKDILLDDNLVSRSFYTADSTRSGKWTYLNGTLDEAQNIDNMAKSKKIQSQLFTGSQAIEERFKSLSGEKSPTVVHIATHGFFFPDPKIDKKKLEMMSFQVDNKFTLADNSMNRSGLLMAGGNRAWIGEDVISDREDGILTAYEVSNMSLFNTELVVLSACETGLGDIKGSEGVYGLQRAFKQAGVRYLMMSLWKVPDTATKEFMTAFYTEYLTNGKSVREAFNITQSKMKDKYRNEPYKWGGFVLME